MDKVELCYTPASELARIIAAKDVSPTEVMETVLERLDALNPRLNAVCTPTPELAMDRARQAEQAVMDGAPLGPAHAHRPRLPWS